MGLPEPPAGALPLEAAQSMERPSEPPPAPADAALSDDERRVAEVLERVRAGIRQRQAELATLAGGEETKLRLLELKTLEYVEEPLAVSPRAVIGRALVFFRKASFHLLFKWWARPVLQRQNRFNQVASQLLHEIVGNQARLAEALGAAHRRIEELEGRLAAAEAAGKRAPDGAGR